MTAESGKDECRICDDPRQYVPPEGQRFTTLRKMREKPPVASHESFGEGGYGSGGNDVKYKNVWWQDEVEKQMWSVRTEPQVSNVASSHFSPDLLTRRQFAIGNRAELIQTSAGNILWDLIPYLDEDTVNKINELGGLKAIVISHPHYYSTYADWSRTFQCPVYVGKPDREWLERSTEPGVDVRFLTAFNTPILEGSGATAILAGGHFPGSLLLHWRQNLFIADTIFPVPSAFDPEPGRPGKISFTFFWSIPNRIPLHPDDILTIWHLVKPLEFHTAFGAFKGMDIRTMGNEASRGTGGVKGRLLESCKIYVKAMGWEKHGMLSATI